MEFYWKFGPFAVRDWFELLIGDSFGIQKTIATEFGREDHPTRTQFNQDFFGKVAVVKPWIEKD